jgi:hypothetical protein
MNTYPQWRKWLPNIAIRLTLPFLKIETTFCYERHESLTVEWTGIYIQVWKYEFRFQWYWKPAY